MRVAPAGLSRSLEVIQSATVTACRATMAVSAFNCAVTFRSIKHDPTATAESE